MSNPLERFSMDWFRLDGKVAMVTGANQGLGMAYAVAFAKAGADLFIPHFTEDDLGDQGTQSKKKAAVCISCAVT